MLMADQLIESLSDRSNPGRIATPIAQLLDLIDVAGPRFTAELTPAVGYTVIDLMAALEASMRRPRDR
jgi:hypothetical protein